jgi:hypothetical protein
VGSLGAPGLLGGEQLGGPSGSGGLSGPALLLAKLSQREAQPAELGEGLQELAGVGPADEKTAPVPAAS